MVNERIKFLDGRQWLITKVEGYERKSTGQAEYTAYRGYTISDDSKTPRLAMMGDYDSPRECGRVMTKNNSGKYHYVFIAT